MLYYKARQSFNIAWRGTPSGENGVISLTLHTRLVLFPLFNYIQLYYNVRFIRKLKRKPKTHVKS